MYILGHKGITLLLYSPILFITFVFEFYVSGILGLGIVLLVYSIPDKDITIRKYQSKMNEYVPLIDLERWFGFLFITHRGITHTIWFSILVGITFGFIALLLPTTFYTTIFFASEDFAILFIGFTGMYGILTHFAGDIITPRGISPFSPIYNKTFSFSLVHAKSESWNRRFYKIGSFTLVFTVISWCITFIVIYIYGFSGYEQLAIETLTLLSEYSETIQ